MSYYKFLNNNDIGLVMMVLLRLGILVSQKICIQKNISINFRTVIPLGLLSSLLSRWQLKVFMMEYSLKNQMWLV